jgi:membrane-bound serine protease (ClpP class)
MMFREPGLAPPRAAIYGATLACAILFGVVLGALLRTRRRPVVSGDVTLIGAAGRVAEWAGDEGRVQVQGVYWRARAAAPLADGESVRVIGRDGLWLLVERMGR